MTEPDEEGEDHIEGLSSTGKTSDKLKFGEALQRSKSFRQGDIASMLGQSSYGTQFLNKLQRDTIFETAFTDQRK